MRKIVALLGLTALLGACSATEQAKVSTDLATAETNAASVVSFLCKTDAGLQPVAVNVATQVAVLASVVSPSTATAIGAGVAVDVSTVHPAIVKACPGTVVATSVPVPVAAPAAQ